jgi:hypothetical protein
MRTTTTTREQTWNKSANYPLKLFLWHLGHLSPVFQDAHDKLKVIETREIVRDGSTLTNDAHAVYVINVYLEGHKDD